MLQIVFPNVRHILTEISHFAPRLDYCVQNDVAVEVDGTNSNESLTFCCHDSLTAQWNYVALPICNMWLKYYLLPSFGWLVKHLVEENFSFRIRPNHIQAFNDAFLLKLDFFKEVFWRRKIKRLVSLLEFGIQLSCLNLFDRWQDGSSIVWPRYFSLLWVELQTCIFP